MIVDIIVVEYYGYIIMHTLNEVTLRWGWYVDSWCGFYYFNFRWWSWIIILVDDARTCLHNHYQCHH